MMFWDNVAGIYDIFVNVINRKTHKALKAIISGLLESGDTVLECACGTGMLTAVIAGRCAHVTATDYSKKMLEHAKRNCRAYSNITFEQADITALPYPDERFDKVIAANVIHLLDDPFTAMEELNRVCRTGGKLIIPTYMNKEETGKNSRFSDVIGQAGADFKRQFTTASYERFFRDAGYEDVQVFLADGRIPCAAAVMTKKAEKK